MAEAKLLGYDIKLTKTVWKRGCDFASPFPEENDRLPESPVLPDSFALVHPNSVDLKASNYSISLLLTCNSHGIFSVLTTGVPNSVLAGHSLLSPWQWLRSGFQEELFALLASQLKLLFKARSGLKKLWLKSMFQ